jgi:hypothetical protein
MRIRPSIGTLCGAGIGVVAIVIWMLTFQPHGNVALSRYRFPLSALILQRMYPAESIPVPLWYGGALVQWLALGAFVDLLRRSTSMSDGFGQHDPRKMPPHLFFGALHIDYSTAMHANSRAQNFSVCPRHWYVDATFRCARCGLDFVFTAEEQRFWYEQLGFWIDSRETLPALPRRTASSEGPAGTV